MNRFETLKAFLKTFRDGKIVSKNSLESSKTLKEFLKTFRDGKIVSENRLESLETPENGSEND